MRHRWLIAIAFCTAILGFIFVGYNYIYINDKFPSDKDAKEIAEWRLRKSIQEIDPVFKSWEHSTLGDPVLVRTLEGEPSYWIVPVTFKDRIIGYIDVDKNKSIPRYGQFCEKPELLSACPSILVTPEEAAGMAKNITTKYPGANVSVPILVYDGDPGNAVWMLKVEEEGKIISRIYVTPVAGFVYERKEGEIIKNVAGINIAFEGSTSKNEVKSILDSYNLISPYELKYNVTGTGPFFYTIIQEGDFETIKNNLQKKGVNLQKTSKKRNGQIIVMVDGILPENQLIPISESYNLSLKRFMWVTIDYKGSDISEKDGSTLKEGLERNEKIIYTHLEYRRG
ncbi:MAG: UPF0228 family protein [Candidatus Methanoperedens sp.]|nr:UPF0228 family protein [Candidatus Methanoperedens sp.]